LKRSQIRDREFDPLTVLRVPNVAGEAAMKPSPPIVHHDEGLFALGTGVGHFRGR
jgi:hypothetical protein